MKQIPGNIYYINNKTYVGHVNDLKTVVYDTSKLLEIGRASCRERV